MRFALRALAAPVFAVSIFGLAGACGSSSSGSNGPTGTRLILDLSADFTDSTRFFDFPYPTDARLKSDGTVDGAAFPNPLGKELISNLQIAAGERKGFPVAPAAYFHFTGAISPSIVETHVLTAGPIYLIDVDEASPDRGTTYPVIATSLPPDDYIPDAGVLAVAPRPGIVLHPHRAYAFFVLASVKDAQGNDLDINPDLAKLVAGTSPGGAHGDAAAPLFGKLGATLAAKPIDGVDVSKIAAATVFTTGDVVKDLADLGDRVTAKYTVTIDGLQVNHDDDAEQDRYCRLTGTVTFPQFQTGTPPFDTQGTFDMSDTTGGTPDAPLPKKQRDEVAPITITFPKGQMPANGWPLVLYFHGSGGVSAAVVDRGVWKPLSEKPDCPSYQTPDAWNGVTGCNVKGQGPAYVLAPHGIGAAGAALPVNPERLPGATDYAYLNLSNLSALRDVFRQGVLEQRMFLRALSKLQVDPSVVSSCTGLSLPAGATTYHYDPTKVLAQGQSMGGMYTNIIGAVEPKIRAVVPTGAGGYWTYFMFHSHFGGVDSLQGLIASILGTADALSFLHPAVQLIETAWEPSDPYVFTPRLARRPLDGHPVRSVYETMGLGDSYFTPEVYDEMAMAYGHPEAGDAIWTSMQDALKLVGLDGLRPYPIQGDVSSDGGTKYTGIAVQYAGDGVYDPHAIYSQLDSVKYQYGCFFESFLRDGIATVPPVAPLGTPCP